MFCRFCGTENDNSDSFCKKCGKPLIPVEEPDRMDTEPPEEQSEEAMFPSVSDDMAAKEAIKRGYFLHRVTFFLVFLTFFVVAWALTNQNLLLSDRIMGSIATVFLCGMLISPINHQHEKLVGKDVIDASGLYEHIYGNKMKWIVIISWGIGVIVHLLTWSELGFWGGFRVGTLAFFFLGTVISMIWAFKIVGVLLVIVVGGVLLRLGLLLAIVGVPSSEQSGIDYSPRSSYESQARILDAYLSSYGNRDILVVSCQWINTSTQTETPIYSISTKAFQNGIELEQALFADINDSVLAKEVRPGVTIDFEAAFYLNDASDVEVEITPFFDLADEVYAYEVFSLN